MYRYNGPADSADVANSLIYGGDGNIYAAGYSQGVGTSRDIIVISLNKDTGDTNWVYRYNGPGNSGDDAYSIVYGADGNVYAAGYSTGSGTGTDFIVISLNKDTGDTNWVYRYNGPGNGWDGASSIVYGADGNVYTAGDSRGIGTYNDFTVISLTATGSERWVYRYDDPDHNRDWANSIVYGVDGNLYVAGEIGCRDTINHDYYNLGIISLTSSGSERWVYVDSVLSYDVTEEIYSIVYGGDGNIYAGGHFSLYHDIVILSLTSDGTERWTYSYAGPPGSSGDAEDEIRSIVYGADGYIYAAGVSDSTDWTNLTPAFTVISLTSGGSERWVYRYYSGVFDWANSIVYGADSNLYAVGTCFQGTAAFGVISLTPAGGERWIYRYNSPYDDEGRSVIYGADGYIYAAGYSENRNGSFAQDILVVSLDPESGIDEQSYTKINKDDILSIATLQRNTLNFTISLPEPAIVRLSVYNIIGEKVLSWTSSLCEGTTSHTKDLSGLSSGIYILKAETSRQEYSESRRIIYVR